jgi:hypothetical protein
MVRKYSEGVAVTEVQCIYWYDAKAKVPLNNEQTPKQ